MQVGEAIAAYLRAADTSKYNEVIAKANEVRAALCMLRCAAMLGMGLFCDGHACCVCCAVLVGAVLTEVTEMSRDSSHGWPALTVP